MSALGQKRTSRVLEEKSALPPKADIRASAVGAGMVQHDDRTPTPEVPPANFIVRSRPHCG
jgi:hypothetical protein